MKKEVLKDFKVRFELVRYRLLGKWLNLYRRRTWTPSELHWLTDYGVEIVGLAVWVHVPTWLWDDEKGARR